MQCPCGKKFAMDIRHAHDHNIGRLADCPNCGRKIRIPAPTEIIQTKIFRRHPIVSLIFSLGLLAIGFISICFLFRGCRGPEIVIKSLQTLWK